MTPRKKKSNVENVKNAVSSSKRSNPRKNIRRAKTSISPSPNYNTKNDSGTKNVFSETVSVVIEPATSDSKSKTAFTFKPPVKNSVLTIATAKYPSANPSVTASHIEHSAQSNVLKAPNIRVANTTRKSVQQRLRSVAKAGRSKTAKKTSCEREYNNQISSKVGVPVEGRDEMPYKVSTRRQQRRGIRDNKDCDDSVSKSSPFGLSSHNLEDQPSGIQMMASGDTKDTCCASNEKTSPVDQSACDTKLSETRGLPCLTNHPKGTNEQTAKNGNVIKRNRLSLMKKVTGLMDDSSLVSGKDYSPCNAVRLRDELADGGCNNGIPMGEESDLDDDNRRPIFKAFKENVSENGDYQGILKGKKTESQPAKKTDASALSTVVVCSAHQILPGEGKEKISGIQNSFSEKTPEDCEKKKREVLHKSLGSRSGNEVANFSAQISHITTNSQRPRTTEMSLANFKKFESKNCARTEGCPKLMSRRRDLDDFELESSFRHFRCSNRKKLSQGKKRIM